MRKFFLTLVIFFLFGTLGVYAQDDMPVLAYGQMIDGSLNADQPSTFYAFDALRNDVITITMEVTGGEIDPFLVLNDSARRPLITDDNSGGGVNARLTFVIPGDGRYIIQSTHAGGGLAEITGTFRLMLTSAGFEGEPVLVDPAAVQTALPTPTAAVESTPAVETTPIVESTPTVSDAPVEQGDSTRLVALTTGSRINDILTRQTPLRFYWFEAGEGEQATLTPEPLDAFQPLFVLYNASFTEIQRSADGTALTASFDTDGVYFVSVSVPDVTSPGGSYGFSFDLRGNMAQAGNFIDMLYGQSQQGTIDNNVPAVTYRFFGSAGDNVTISMSRVGGDLDSYLYLFDSNGQPLFEDNDSGGTDGNARIVFSLPADGAYLIMATRLGQTQGTTSGSYLLDLLSDAAPPVVQPTAAPTLPADYADFPTIAYDQTVEGQITASKFLEVYVFEGNQDDAIIIEMNSQNADQTNGLDPMMVLLDDSRIPLIENDDIVDGEVRDSRIEFTLPKTGYYAIVATRFDQEQGTSEGGYTLTLTGPGSIETTPEDETPAESTPVTRIPSTALEPGTPVQDIFDQPVTAYTFNAAAN
ncbi:MAG TPA: PPC domain-containing protein, partial [Aggregatilineaceae bacterium]|nr:PPC domain-containing protein [Aggregatilineaceae bacterium]